MAITGATTPVTLTGYRWFVTAYQKSDLSAFTGGTFRFECNWLESYLDCPEGVASQTGSGDLVIMVGFDSSGANLIPDKFLYVSGNSGVYGGRTNGQVAKLNGGNGTNNSIEWLKGTITSYVNKCWLFIGYKSTVQGKALILSDILFSGN
jgi:hypothetical protein